MTGKILVLFILQFFSLCSFAGELPDFPFIYSVGSAEREVPPDMVEFAFYVKTFDENPDKAFNALQQQNAELGRLFKEAGIADENIESYKIDKTAIREQKDYQELKILGYELKQKFEISTKNVNQYAAVMDKLIKYRNVADFYARFDVAERKDIETSLMSAACADAESRAKAMAAGVGAEIDSVFAISEIPFASIEDAFGVGGRDNIGIAFSRSQHDGDAHLMNYIPAFITITKKVNLIYRLVKK